MKRLTKWLMFKVGLAVLTTIGLANVASAFPSWMGVYGGLARHTDGENPGNYTILMNQDYWGLHAEVGVQVNGGSWSIYQMDYAGNMDGNSKWTHTPGQPYPIGATIKYYFHGYDNWGGNIWDTNGGNNYTFNTAVLPWPGGAAAGYPSDPAWKIHHWKEEAVVGNQFISVMIDQNGSVYDIYYPSSGFRNGSGTANEGYKGPEEFIGGPFGCSTDKQANGQMNVIAGMGGLGVGVNIYWLKNANGTDYTGNSQAYVTDNNVVVTSNRLNMAGNNIQVVQYDFCPTLSALPVVTDGVRTNNGVYVKRFLLTNLESSSRTVDFYFDMNFNVKGDNAHDAMYVDTHNTMVVVDNANRTVTGTGCGPNGYGGSASTEYNPRTTASYDKGLSVAFGTVLKEVTNTVTGAGIEADCTWRDHAAYDNHEGWIGKRITIPAGGTKEIDVMIVGSWDDFSYASDTHEYWGRPLVDWFMANSMATAQATTESYWSNWLAQGVTVDLPGTQYDALFKRSLLATALHIDKASGSIIAGMHNGAYPFVWPRDGIYAAITLDRTGHPADAEPFYHWLRDIAYRAGDCNPGGKSFFYQKYTTDGHFAWNSPQVDETASVPWGIYYHYRTTKDATFLSNYWNLARETAYASYYTSCVDNRLYYDFNYHLMNGNNVWEDSFSLFIYSNASVVRGLWDAASLADVVGASGDASNWRGAASDIRNNGIIPRVNARVEPADISHLGLAVPYEVFEPTNTVMLAVKEWIHGNGAPAGGFNDNLEETGGGNAGYWRRYNHNVGGNIDNYWNGGPWFLSTSWYGEYNARWQDYQGGKSLIDVNLNMLDKLVARLGPCGLGAEQIAPDYAQKYPGFWLQTAWPNVWESHSTLLDQMMMFLDFKPAEPGSTTVSFAPKLPSAWSTMTFNNLYAHGERFNITVSESAGNSRADINKLTTGALGYDIHLRIPAGVTPTSVVKNGVSYTPAPSDYDTTTGRVRVTGSLDTGANSIVVNY